MLQCCTWQAEGDPVLLGTVRALTGGAVRAGRQQSANRRADRATVPPLPPSLAPPAFPPLILSSCHAPRPDRPPACFSRSRPARRIAGTAVHRPSSRQGGPPSALAPPLPCRPPVLLGTAGCGRSATGHGRRRPGLFERLHGMPQEWVVV